MVFKEVKHIVLDFIWEGKTYKIALDVLVQQSEEGGLKLVDFEDTIKKIESKSPHKRLKKERWMASLWLPYEWRKFLMF